MQGHNALPAVLADAVEAYSAANPESQALHERASQVMPGGNTRTVLYYTPFPLTMVSGSGCRLEDADGHTYVDFLGEFTAGLYGHSDPLIAEAIAKAVANGVNLGSHGPQEAAFAEAIKDRFPSMELLRFTNSGTEANMLALALAKHATGRGKVMVFEGAYHGGTLTFPASEVPVNVPHEYVFSRFNEIEATRQAIRETGSDLACVIVEPMMGSGGCIPGDPAFLQMLREETEAAGALLVFDEVMTSRLSPGGLQSELGIRPDLTTLGKYIGGGMSFGAFGGRAEVMSNFDPSKTGSLPHAGTFNNNVLTMAAGLAGLTKRLTPAAVHDLNARGDSLRRRINAVLAGAGAGIIVTGIGSLMNIHPMRTEPKRPADLAGADQRMRDLIFFDLLEDGFYTARRGLLALSLPIGDAECDALVAAVARRAPRWAAFLGKD
ncbi:aspartate aminotransferase family protein [Aquibium oceanicum]|uniref:Aspartate aminotransferase family protein n=1 Tax=Aquibium oceanicum TaxID=1670800 RepID=A0A1L3SZM0_9HYPH|nr:aminotransferase class III-fold pyridoxal phosphate-dependent enzyme [Aquibium oceanicum]APH74735.1 aspartate aminotransferase family protein [Aquibium oceanicum]